MNRKERELHGSVLAFRSVDLPIAFFAQGEKQAYALFKPAAYSIRHQHIYLPAAVCCRAHRFLELAEWPAVPVGQQPQTKLVTAFEARW